jgi:uncharacterized membrane protein
MSATTVLLRAAALGAASGLRSTAGPAAVAVAQRRGRGPALALAAGEFAADKLPVVPPRTQLLGLLPRLASGGGCAALVARRQGRAPLPAALVGAAAAAGAAALGVRWRAAASRRLGRDLPGGLVEDAVAVLLATAGARRPEHGRGPRR